MKKAQLYEKRDDDKVQCHLCAHECVISLGKRGICGVRENQGGTLYSLNYSKVIARHIDPIEKKPLFHFLPGSRAYSVAAAGCNFRCDFCQNWQISQVTKGESRRIVGEELSPEKIVSQAVSHDCQSVAYTYTEPAIFFEYAYDVAQLAHDKELKNIFVTNGFQTQQTIDKMTGLIDAANIDLKSFSDDYYKKVCGARLQPVLNSIQAMHEAGIWLEVTTLIVPEQNDSQEELTQIAELIVSVSPDIPWHISRFFPQYKMDDTGPTPLKTLTTAYDIGHKSGLNYIYFGNVAPDYYSNTECANGHTVIKRDGHLLDDRIQNDCCPECGEKIPGIFT